MLHDTADQHVAVGIRDDIDVDLNGMIEKAVEQHRRRVGHAYRFADIARQIRVVVNDFHRAATEHITRPHDQRIADFAGERERLVGIVCDAIGRLSQAEFLDQFLESLAIFGKVDRIGRRADDRHTGGFERACELQRGLSAVLHDDAFRLFLVDDLEHVFERHRLEIQAIGSVVVGRDSLRIAVDHDGFIAILA